MKETFEVFQTADVAPGIVQIGNETSPDWGNLFDRNGRTTDNMKLYDAFRDELKKTSSAK